MQKYISEFIGTFVLLVSIVGSGIAGQQYTNDQMVILVSHAVVIGLTLIFIIGIFANFSGAHFNPIVSIFVFLTKRAKQKRSISIHFNTDYCSYTRNNFCKLYFWLKHCRNLLKY